MQHPSTVLRPKTNTDTLLLHNRYKYREAVHSEATYSEAVHSEAVHSEATYSEAVHREATYSEAVRSEAVHREAMFKCPREKLIINLASGLGPSYLNSGIARL